MEYSDRESHPPSAHGSVETPPTVSLPTNPAMRGYGRGRARRSTPADVITPPVGRGAASYFLDGTPSVGESQLLEHESHKGASQGRADQGEQDAILALINLGQYPEAGARLPRTSSTLRDGQDYDLWLADRLQEQARRDKFMADRPTLQSDVGDRAYNFPAFPLSSGDRDEVTGASYQRGLHDPSRTNSPNRRPPPGALQGPFLYSNWRAVGMMFDSGW